MCVCVRGFEREREGTGESSGCVKSFFLFIRTRICTQII